jgi:hypothetical protein
VLQIIGTAFSYDAAKPLRPKVNKCQGLTLQCVCSLWNLLSESEREEGREKSLSACVLKCVYVFVCACMCACMKARTSVFQSICAVLLVVSVTECT